MRSIWLTAIGVALIGLLLPGYGGTEELTGNVVEGVRVVMMEAFRFGYRPDPVVVEAGERVRLLLTATDTTHGFAISELEIDRKLTVGEETEIEFTAPGAGTYTIFCTVYCGPGHQGMRARLIVR